MTHKIKDALASQVSYWVVLMACIILLPSCSSTATDGATLVQEASSAYEQQNYRLALDLLDSLRRNYPLDTISLRQSILLTRKIRYDSAVLELKKLRPALAQTKERISKLESQFVLVGGETPFYIHKILNPALIENERRNYVYFYVQQEGGLEPVSVYHGTSRLNHSSIAVDTIRLLDVPEDKALNYRYATDDTYHETVTYTTPPNDSTQMDNLLRHLISLQRPRVDYLSRGRIVFRYIPTPEELKALQITYDFNQALGEVFRSQERIRVLEALIQKNKPK